MTRDEVYTLCKQVAPKYGFDPLLILALCEQESAYDETEARLEQGFYRKYVRPKTFATSVEVLFSASYGLTQCMGWTLNEMGYFADPRMAVNLWIPHRIDQYMVTPRDQIDYGCRWLKRKQGDGSIEKALLRYNGSAEYPPQVIRRYEKLTGVYT